MLYIIIAILMFGFLIAIHEFGHYATAKLLGVRVLEFSIGMGPALFSKEKKGTVYSLRAFPMGGYCAMEGEDEASHDPSAFTNAKAWKRFVILVAGSFMNFVTGLVLLAILLSQSTGFVVPVIDSFVEGFPYQGEAGLMEGDRILKVDGEAIYTKADLDTFFSRSEDGVMDLVIQRDGQVIQLDDFLLAPAEYMYNGQLVLMRGIICQQVDFTIGTWLQQSWYQAVDMVRLVRLSLQDMVQGEVSVSDVSGPIGIVTIMSDVGEQSASVIDAIYNLLWFSAFIAINLAVMNLLPIPALDGGRIFFLFVNQIYTLVTRKKLNPKYEGYVNMAGFACLILLMIVVAFQDVMRIFT